MHRLLFALALAGCVPRCPGDGKGTPHEEIVARRARRVAELEAHRCLPAWGSGIDLELGFEGAPIACASESADGFALGAPLACWQIDATTGQISPRPPRLLAGHAAIMAVENGRVAGLPVGPASWQLELDDSNFMLAISADRRHAVVSTRWTGIDMDVYDLATGALVHHITDDAVDDGITGLAYVDDRIYRAGATAEWREPALHHIAGWRDDGQPLVIDAPPDFSGEIEVVSPHAIALSSHDRRVVAIAAADGTRTLERPTGDPVPRGFVARSDDEALAIDGALLRTFSGPDLAPGRTVALPRCP